MAKIAHDAIFLSKCSKWNFWDLQNVQKQQEIHQGNLLN